MLCNPAGKDETLGVEDISMESALDTCCDYFSSHKNEMIREQAWLLYEAAEPITKWVSKLREKEEFKERVEAVRRKVEENRYRLEVSMPVQEVNTYTLEFIGTYSDVKKRFAKACQNLQEGKWDYNDIAHLADRADFEDYADGCFNQTHNLEGFNQRIEKVKDDYKAR